MAGAADKAAKVFLENLPVDKPLSSARNRDRIPTGAEHEHQNNPGMEAELRHDIPSSLQNHEDSGDKRRQQNTERSLRQRADADKRIKDISP